MTLSCCRWIFPYYLTFCHCFVAIFVVRFHLRQYSRSLEELICAKLVVTLYAGVAFAFALLLTRTMALGSLAFGLALPICSYFTNQEQSVFFFALFGGIFLFFTHRSNIVQLLSKGERTVLKTDD